MLAYMDMHPQGNVSDLSAIPGMKQLCANVFYHPLSGNALFFVGGGSGEDGAMLGIAHPSGLLESMGMVVDTNTRIDCSWVAEGDVCPKDAAAPLRLRVSLQDEKIERSP